jgi:hypothetical protein
MSEQDAPKTDPLPKPAENDVHSPDFQSKADPYFTAKEKEKDHWTRRSSIKLEGKWT